MTDLFFSFYYLWQKVLGRDPIFEDYLRGRPVLDIGCGQGELLKKDSVNFQGLDANSSMVAKLRQAGLSAVVGEATALPFGDQSFAAVYCRNLIEHLAPADAYRMLSEAARVLAPGGRLILISPMPVAVWSTFGHLKPYPPVAIKKILRTVSLERMDSVLGLTAEHVVYLGSWAGNRLGFFLTTVIANLTPFSRGSYLMILRKK